MARTKNTKDRLTGTKTKAIADSVNTGVATTAATTTNSIVGLQSLEKALTPKQAFELNVTARTAITARATNVAKASLRLFARRSGDEIISGDLYDLLRHPAPYYSTSRLVSELVFWHDLLDEFAVLVIEDKVGRVAGLKVLDPTMLRERPYGVTRLEDVQAWEYYEGGIRLEIPPRNLIFHKGFNPYSHVRGLSRLITGSQEVSNQYFATRFNTSFFQNGCATDIIAKFPKGTKKEVAQEWVDQWTAKHSVFNNNGFKVSAVIADQVDIESPGQVQKDGQYMQLMAWDSEQIAGLYGVPASVMGFYSKTRFDTIDKELEAFMENALMPLMTTITETLQTQLVDRFYRSAAGNTKKEAPRLGRMCRKALADAQADRVESDTVILLDPDSLPIMATLQQGKVDYAQKLRLTFGMTAEAAAEFVGLDLPENFKEPPPEPVQPPAAQVDELAKKLDALEKQLADQEPKQMPAQAKATLDTLTKAVRDYRSVVLAAVSKGQMYDKAAALEVAKATGNARFVVQAHKDFLAVKQIMRSEEADKVAVVKEHLNAAYRKSNLKTLVMEENPAA
jgi:HK97 family phage portal protein